MSWKDKPTLIRRVNKNKTYVFFDESGQLFDLKTLLSKRKNGESLGHRASVFVLNAVFMSSLNVLNASKVLNSLKDKTFGQHDFIFHNREIEGKEGVFKSLTPEKETLFYQDLGEALLSARFSQMAFAAYKDTIVEEMIENEDDKTIDVISKFYGDVLARINSVIHSNKKKHATLVFEETSPQLDGLILKIAVKMKEDKRLRSIDGVYFAKKKKPSSYWSGMEIADLTSNGIYKIIQIHEFALTCEKLINYPKGYDNPIVVFQYRLHKEKTARTSRNKKHSGRRQMRARK